MVSFIQLPLITALKYMRMGEFFYAVHRGWQIGVFDTWAECQVNVTKFPNAKFKKFATLEEAQNFADHGSSDVVQSQFEKVLQPLKRNAVEPPVHKPVPRAATARARASNLHNLIGSSLTDEVLHHCPCCIVGQALETSKRMREELYSQNVQNNKRKKTVHHQRVSKRSKAAHVPHRALSSAGANGLPQVEVYTDGACSHNGRRGARAGLGVHWVDKSYNSISERLDGKQTNQRAELTAAIRAIEEAEKKGVPRLKLHTDSKYTINCATEWIQRWKKNGWKTAVGKEVVNKDDIVQLDNLCGKVDVEWVYVPGHSNIPGNEAADKLAREGAGKPL